ncbi:MAG: AAA family ATPase [Candidatus Poribacteria bacterium]|nr:AAA family ATPase [Candidatus Poribacteria bacterium]
MFNSISSIVQELQAVTKRPYLVGIDGRSGAGKSILSHRLHEQLTDAVVVHKDDFYRVMDEAVRATFSAEQGYYRYFDWQRLEQQVLLPLTAQQTARYQRYDWVKEELAETIEVSSTNIIIVEGVYSTRPELTHYYDLCIWVETSETERFRRQIARGENTSEWIQHWAAAEIFYVANFRPSRSAHMIVVGE